MSKSSTCTAFEAYDSWLCLVFVVSESLGDCSFLNTCFHMDTCKVGLQRHSLEFSLLAYTYNDRATYFMWTSGIWSVVEFKWMAPYYMFSTVQKWYLNWITQFSFHTYSTKALHNALIHTISIVFNMHSARLSTQISHIIIHTLSLLFSVCSNCTVPNTGNSPSTRVKTSSFTKMVFVLKLRFELTSYIVYQDIKQ